MAEDVKKGVPALIGHSFPVISWLRSYNVSLLRPDIIAGIIVAAFTIPDAMANASLAGLPLQLGLYASIMALLAYGIFGTSRQLAIGPTTTVTILVVTSLGALADSDPSKYLALAALAAILIGVISLIARIFKLSFIVNLISEPVLIGTYIGTGLIIAISQLPKLLGFHGISGGFFRQAYYILTHLGLTNSYSMAIGLAAMALLILFEKKFKKVPGPLVVMALAILLMSFTDLAGRGVSVIGKVPQGLPSLGIPAFTLADVTGLVTLATACYLLSYISDFSVAERFAKEHKYEYDANQELLAVGASNLASGIAGGFPVGPSMVRSVVNDSGGAKTQMSGIISALLIVLVILFFTGLLSNLPQPVLPALIIVASKSLINIPALQRIASISKRELIVAVASTFIVLTVGMLAGIIIGVILSMLDMLSRVSYPHISVLGKLPDRDRFADMGRNPEAVPIPGIAIYRVDASIIFANVKTVKKEILNMLDKAGRPVKLVVLDLGSTPYLDITGVDMLDELYQQLIEQEKALRLANITASVKNVLKKAGFEKRYGRLPQKRTITEVINEWESGL